MHFMSMLLHWLLGISILVLVDGQGPPGNPSRSPNRSESPRRSPNSANPSAQPSASAHPSASRKASHSPRQSPSAKPSISACPSASREASRSPSHSPSAKPSVSARPSASREASRSPSHSPSAKPSISARPSASREASRSPSPSLSAKPKESARPSTSPVAPDRSPSQRPSPSPSKSTIPNPTASPVPSTSGEFVPPPPTQAHPRFMNPKLRAEWTKLWADYNRSTEPGYSWFAFLKRHAVSDSAVPSGWLTYHGITMYQVTQDPYYARLTWKSVLGNFINKYPNYVPPSSGSYYGGDNNARIILSYWVDVYDWLYTGINATERTLFYTKLANLVDYTIRGSGATCCSYNAYANWPLRSTDQDVTIDNYFALLKYYATTADINPHAVQVWSTKTNNLGGVIPVSYFNGTTTRCGNNCYNSSDLRINMRTSMAALMAKYASGGGGISSSGYNLEGEVSHIAYNWAGLRSAFGVDYFPELIETTLRWAVQQMSAATPDLQWCYRWGDDEASVDPEDSLLNTFSVITATTGWFFSDPRQGPLRQFVLDMTNRWMNSKHWFPYDTYFYAYEHLPTAPKGDYKALSPAPGGAFTWDSYGLGTYRTGWSDAAALFGYEWAPYSELDHFTQHVGNFQLYRNGLWAVYTPMAYGRPTSAGLITNTMNFYGWPDGDYHYIQEFKGMLDVQVSPTANFFVGAQAGTHRYSGAWVTPATWQQEYTRSVLYSPGAKVDVIIAFDRSNIIDPRTFPKWNVGNWWESNPDIAAYFSQYPRRRWQWYCNERPTITANTLSFRGGFHQGDNNVGYTWNVSARLQTTIRTHFTATTYTTVANSVWPSDSDFYWTPEENLGGYLAYESRAVDSQFDATAHVIFAADAGASFSSQEFSSTNLKAKGVVVSRAGSDDLIATFNVAAGPLIPSPDCSKGPCTYDPRVPLIVPKQHYFNATDAFSFSGIQTQTPKASVYLHNLNPISTYYLFIDSVFQRSVGSIPVGGFAEVFVTGLAAGSHTLCFQPATAGLCGAAP
eukprot:EG_transcript_765